MTKLLPNSQSINKPRNVNPEFPSSETPEEAMSPPSPWHLREFKPKILSTTYRHASVKDREILGTLYEMSGNLSTQLQRSTTFELKVREIYDAADDCTNREGSEDSWTSFVVEPILKLALKLSRLDHTVRIVPLRTTTVNPDSLLPQWNGVKVSKKIDIGLAVKLDSDIVSHHIDTLPKLEDEDNGIGPAATVDRLRTHPLFCHIEVKRQHQPVDSIVQLAVWTSAVYTRWEQVKNLRNSSRDDFPIPISFGWTIAGSRWRLHLIRRLPDGSRQITKSPRVYDTSFLPDVYRIIVTLHWLMKYGQGQFRKEFLESVLGVQA